MRACTRVLPWVMTECVRVAGLPLLSTSEGILRRTAALYQAFSGARQGWWGGGWWLVVGGWLSLTDGLHRLLTRATLIYHTEPLTKPPVLKGNL